MDFHYNVIQKQFPGRHHLLYSDTDSLVYELQHENIYDWVWRNKSLFDLSDMERANMKDNENKKVVGKMKDETHGLQITEFTSLKSARFIAFKYQTKDELKLETKKCCKGVSKTVVKRR
jgi:hypothetical protein